MFVVAWVDNVVRTIPGKSVVGSAHCLGRMNAGGLVTLFGP